MNTYSPSNAPRATWSINQAMKEMEEKKEISPEHLKHKMSTVSEETTAVLDAMEAGYRKILKEASEREVTLELELQAAHEILVQEEKEVNSKNEQLQCLQKSYDSFLELHSACALKTQTFDASLVQDLFDEHSICAELTIDSMEADQNHQKELEARVEALQEAFTKEITRVEKMKMITDAWRQEVVSVQSKLDEALQQTAYQTAEIERLTVKYSKLEHSMSMNSNQWIIPTIQASSGHKASASPTITEELDFLAKCEAKLPQQLSGISSTVPAIGQSTFSSSTVPNPVNISQTVTSPARPYNRKGRPKGSKNRKTLEREALARAETARLAALPEQGTVTNSPSTVYVKRRAEQALIGGDDESRPPYKKKRDILPEA